MAQNLTHKVQLPDYDPKNIEKKWYQFWEEKGYFKANPRSKKKPYTITIPPPNVTGSLHAGHALYVIQDALIRWKRMGGYEALWLPGTDHAGISTQNVVEKELAEEGLTRHDLGREKFLERVWEWKKKYGDRIIFQLRNLGFSLDWSRLCFTMDENLSKAVREVFVKLYEEGLIYRGHRLIHWCSRCQTALSDLEVQYEERKGKLWYLKYPLKENFDKFSEQFIVVATTRPETMLGDTAVAVHPKDSRYKNFVGKKLILPLLHREIFVIADDQVQKEFGTGAVKVTPAHDLNDFEMGLRHNLEQISIFDKNCVLNENAGSYKGLSREEGRQRVLEDLKKEGLLQKEEEYTLNMSLCERCETIVEPLLSTQWFVKVEQLAKPAIDVVKKGKIKIIPDTWTKTYFHWMENIKDWCISRQLWWGHRIPAWYCKGCEKLTVAREDPSQCLHCKSPQIEQDPDVLDTWFSSALWPFSTLGWPKKTPDLKKFYPNTVMETGFDILFFWVARMIMMGLKFMKDIPFEYVYLHPLVLDIKGKKMSKSCGNTIDPLDVSEKYGVDALRYTLLVLSGHSRSIRLSIEEVSGYRNFMNKIWNASRFALMFLQKDFQKVPVSLRHKQALFGSLSLVDQWILTRLQETIQKVTKDLENFHFGEATKTLYHFVWHEFCDWYIELVKPVLYGENEAEKNKTLFVLQTSLEDILKLLHPFSPHISEEIWNHLPERKEPLIISSYPKVNKSFVFKGSKQKMNFLMELVNNVRNIRGENNISPSKKVNIHCICSDKTKKKILETNEQAFLNLVKGTKLFFESNKSFSKSGLFGHGAYKGVEIFVSLKEAVNVQEEEKRLQKEVGKIEEDLKGIEGRLKNPSFLSKAPEKVVTEHKTKVQELTEQREKMLEALKKIRSLTQ